MIIEGNHQRAWRDDEKRESRLVFIGRDLDEAKLRSGFEACVAWRSRTAPCRPSRNSPSAPSSSRPSSSAIPRPSRSATGPCACVNGPAAETTQRPCRRDPRRVSAPATARSSSPAATTGWSPRSMPRERSSRIAERPRKWIDHVAAGPNGAVAFAAGRQATVRFADGRERSFDHSRAVGGLAFAPKGAAARCRPLRRRDAVVGGHRGGAGAFSNGRARTSPSPSRRTGATSSPPCRRTRCTAGGSRTARTCG